MTSIIKTNGQVFTPDYLVNIILDEVGYSGRHILQKHCMENSCGDGAFLCEIVARYITAYREEYGSIEGVERDIYTYIHGIELDPVAFANCIDNLQATCRSFGVDCCLFDVENIDTLGCTRFDGLMDFVIGNPPYVRVHNLEDKYEDVKRFSFANGGMTDLYLVFFEKGFQMLRPNGKLCYITPSSWLNSLAGSVMRNYVRNNHTLASLIDLGHFQAFTASTYTLISLFEKDVYHNSFAYAVFDPDTLSKRYVQHLSVDEIDINSNFYLADHATLATLKTIFTEKTIKYVTAKNGFATLADKIFISDNFPFTEYIIPTIKASTGKWYKAFFPYDKNGQSFPRDRIFASENVAAYLFSFKEALLKGESEESFPQWYLFGRTQALKDVYTDKLAVNTTVKDVKSVKVNPVPAGSGIYGGLYILSNIDFSIITTLLKSDKFISYISSLKKYKSGGYYTFNSKDLEVFLNYHINILIENGDIIISFPEESGLFACNF